MKIELIETIESDGHWLKVVSGSIFIDCWRIRDGNREDKMVQAEACFERAVKLAKQTPSETVLKSVEI